MDNGRLESRTTSHAGEATSGLHRWWNPLRREAQRGYLHTKSKISLTREQKREQDKRRLDIDEVREKAVFERVGRT